MISIITVTYNNFNDLCKTLNSLKDIDGVERVVINGGNCKKTLNLLKNFDGISLTETD